MNEISPQEEAINLFRSKNESNYIFACQAAVPLILTVDLLYQLWNNFKQYQYIFDTGTTYKIPHIAVSDLLMSGLCHEVGFELYEIEKGIRDQLLTELGLNLGNKRRNLVAAFLKDYAMLEYRFENRKNLKDIHLLTAESILDPGEMEKQIIERINQTEKDADKVNYLLLHQNLLPIGFKSELGNISKSAASKSLSPILISVNDPEAPGVLNVKLPAALRKKVIEGLPTLVDTDEAPASLGALALAGDCLLQQSAELDLGNCGLTDEDFKKGTDLDKTLRRCTHLQILRLNNYASGKPGQASNTQVKREENRLTELPDFLSSLKSLSELYCFGEADNRWGIRYMSPIADLTGLSVLDLSHNEIKKIVGLANLPALRQLNLGNNFIGELKGLKHSTALKNLSLEYNDIRTIQGLDMLVNLQTLNLSNNGITAISGLQNQSGLEFLNLSGNEIREIAQLAKHVLLKKLLIDNNHINSLKGLERLVALEYLDASYNHLRSVIVTDYFPRLQYIHIGFNQISHLSGTDYFPALQILDISKNELSSLEPLLPLLKRTENPARIVSEFSQPKSTYPEIKISDNPLVDPSMEIVQQGNEAIFNYYAEVAKSTTAPLNEPTPGEVTLLPIGRDTEQTNPDIKAETKLPYQFSIKNRADQDKIFWTISLLQNGIEFLKVTDDFIFYKHVIRRMDSIRFFAADKENYFVEMNMDGYYLFKIKEGNTILAVSVKNYQKARDIEKDITDLVSFLQSESSVEKRYDWIRITVTENKKDNPQISSLIFTVHGQNRDSQATLSINRVYVDSLLSDITSRPHISITLFELLLPQTIKELFKEFLNIIWVVDKDTSVYPWEMLQENGDDPIAVRTCMLRDWPGNEVQSFISPVRENDIYLVADPDTEGFTNQIAGARTEAKIITDLFKKKGLKVSVHLNARSTEIINNLFTADYKILHLATHGVYQPDRPEESGILIGKNIFLRPDDLLQMSRMPEMIFVNCTFSGRMGFAQKLLGKGVQTMVLVEGPVTDEAAVEFSKAFYESLFAGNNFGNAITYARNAVYRKFPNQNAWGLYQAYGDPSYRFANISTDTSVKKIPVKNEDWQATQIQRTLPVARLVLDKTEEVYTGFLMEGAALHPALEGELVLLSCFHMVSYVNKSTLGPRNIVITFPELDKKATRFKANKISWADPKHDIVLLRFDNETLHIMRELTRDVIFYSPYSDLPVLQVGQEISVIGHFAEGNLRVSTEKILVVQVDETSIYYEGRVDGSDGEGMSGSPVFTRDWDLLGIYHSGELPHQTTANSEPNQRNNVIRIDAIARSLDQFLDDKAGKKIVKIFLSCPQELNNERGLLIRHLQHLNQGLVDQNTWIIPFTREDDVFDTRAGQEVQSNIIQADIFIWVVSENIGHYSQREFDIAVEQYKNTGKPWMYTFLKTASSKNTPAGTELIRRKLDISGHFYTEFKNGQELEFNFSVQMQKIIGDLISKGKTPVLDKEIQDVVDKYDELRKAMPSGDKRTSLMETMRRELGIKAEKILPYLPLLIATKSGGQRLAVVAALFKFPDLQYRDWLCDRIGGDEQPFIGYHAALALHQLVEQFGVSHKKEVEAVINIAVERATTAKRIDPNQVAILWGTKEQFDKAINSLRGILSGLSNYAAKRSMRS